MGILSKLAMLPLAPVGGVIWLAENLEQVANEQLYGPQAIARELAHLEGAWRRGEISELERRAAETELLERLEP